MRIDFHKWEDFRDCPKKFFLKHIKKEPPTVPKDDYSKIYGKTVEKFFELFCNIWRYKTPYIFPDVIRERLLKIYNDILSYSEVKWSSSRHKCSRDELFELIVADVCAIMDSQNQNFFLNSKSEVSIDATIKDGHVINGRVDFIHYLPPFSQDYMIIDGKGVNKIGKNVSDDQLLFYALLCFFQYKKLPVEIGFFYYKFNVFAHVPLDSDILNEFRARLSLDIKKMTEPVEHRATPTAKACTYCDYYATCLEGLQAKAQRAKKSKIELDGDGLMQFSF